MWEAISNSPGGGVTVVFWGGLFAVWILTSAFKQVRKHLAAKLDHELKMEMVVRGMSADDIERVLAAKTSAAREAAEAACA